MEKFASVPGQKITPSPSRPFADPADLARHMEAQGYICSRDVAMPLFLALCMERPLLAEGPAGTGKTELARALAAATGRPLVRLQCYEGLDESRALYEWEYAKQLLYTQMLKDHMGRELADAPDLKAAVKRLRGQENAFFSRDFLSPRPLLKAILSEEPCVLLIDEVSRADPEFEAFLLEALADFQVTIPELGTLKAAHRPAVILTSNGTRSLSDALRRRCLYLYTDYPAFDVELRIVQLKTAGLDAALAHQAVKFVQSVRRLELRKAPSIGETLDWAVALVILNARQLSAEVLRDSIHALLKDRDDQEKALRQAGRQP